MFGDYVPDFCRSDPQLEKDLRVLFRNEKECEHCTNWSMYSMKAKLLIYWLLPSLPMAKGLLNTKVC